MKDTMGRISREVVTFKGETYHIWNVYVAPKTTMDLHLPAGPNYVRTIVAGDFNSRSPRWGYSARNRTGDLLEDLFDSTNLVRLQMPDTPPILLHSRHGSDFRPDLSLLSADLSSDLTVLEHVGSDHLPALLNIRVTQRCPTSEVRRTWRYAPANWDLFRALRDEALNAVEFSNSVDENYKSICGKILEAAKKAIPRGRMPRYSPFWKDKIEEAVKESQRA